MGAVMICKREPAETPYYIESMGIRIYSMEELAYFLYENIYLVDKRMLGERLWEWLRTEMHNPELAERYATRIIRVLDGKVVSDSNPYDAAVQPVVQGKSREKKPPEGRVSELYVMEETSPVRVSSPVSMLRLLMFRPFPLITSSPKSV